MKPVHQRHSTIKLWSLILVLSAVALYFFLPKFSEFDGIMPLLHTLNWGWFGIATLLMAATFFVTTYIQYAAGNKIGRFSNLFIINMKGLFLNHFLPFNVAIIALTTKYYTRLTDPGRAVFISVVPSIISTVVAITAIALMAPAALTAISEQVHHNIQGWAVPVTILIALGAIITALIYWRHVRPLINSLAREFTSIRSITRITLVALYSIGLLFIFAGVLWASSHATGSPMTILEATTLYVIVWVVSCVVPTPGGLGAAEVALTIGAVSLGDSVGSATATMLVFRFVSFWLPLLPTGIAMFITQKYKRVNKRRVYKKRQLPRRNNPSRA